jgi:HEAT repeat protein
MSKKKIVSKCIDPANDSRTNEELFAASLKGSYDGKRAWAAVGILRRRGTKEVFELAKRNLSSQKPLARARALDVLAQLGAAPGRSPSEGPYKKRSVLLAIKGMEDKNPTVVHSAAWALAHLRGSRAVSRLIKAKGHRMPGVRLAVAFVLGGLKSRAAIRALMELMEDRDKEVRDWATFSISLAWPAPVDSPAIRDALRKRLTDSYSDVRAEAVWGLAKRKDPQGLKLLLQRLEAKSWTSGDEMAAAEILNRTGEIPAAQLCIGIRNLIAEASQRLRRQT